MKRITILLVALLALVVSACGSSEASESAAASEPAATVEPTATPTPDPTPEPQESEEPAESEEAGGDDTALLDLLPDEINGQSRKDVDLAAFPMAAAALQAQGVDASEVEYVISAYGSGEDVLAVTAIRIPGMGQTELGDLGRMMSGMADGQGSVEEVTVGGKEVLAITATEVDQTGYMYFLDGAVIVTGGTSQDLAEEFFSQLP